MSTWLDMLRQACDAGTQTQIAERIGYSAGAISSVLSGTYKGNLDRVQQAVEGALMNSTVDCPVVGDLPRQRCIEHQRTPFTPTNPSRVALYRACRGGCAHSLLGKSPSPQPSPQPSPAEKSGRGGTNTEAV